MENGLTTVFSLFTGEKHFIIPNYQRTYAWGKKQARDLIEDIKNYRGKKGYFLGTVLLQPKGMKDGFEQIEIVDGQQRITSIIIFMKALLKQIKEINSEENITREIRRYLKDDNFHKLQLMELDNEFFRAYIVDDNNFDDSFIKTPSQRRLIRAKRFFEEQLKDLDINLLKEHREKLEKSNILVYCVDDTPEATLIFETNNDRGKVLTDLEKTKSFLMHKIYLAKQQPGELINSIKDRFSDIYRTSEEIGKILSEDNILQYHFISHSDWTLTKQKKEYQEPLDGMKKRINQKINLGNFEETVSFIDNYSRELKESFLIIQKIVSDKNQNLRDVFALGRVANFYPLLIKTYKLDMTESKEGFYKVAKLLEIFSFRVYGIGRVRSNAGETKLFRLARDFQGDFELLKTDIKMLIKEYLSDESFLRYLVSPDFYSEASNLNKRYLFWKYENFLRTNEQPLAGGMSDEEFLSKDPKLRLSIEHIASVNPRVSTSELQLPELNEEFNKNYLNQLGNLTIDPQSANASKSNKAVEIKNSKYFVRAPFKTQNELNDFVENGRWTETSIKKRALKIIEFALTNWNPDVVT